MPAMAPPATSETAVVTKGTKGAPAVPGDPADHGSATNGDGTGSDWPVQATDAIVRTVDAVRDKTTGPALNAARWLTYGLVPALLAPILAVLALVGALRGLEGVLLWIHQEGWAPFLHNPIGIVYLVTGALFVVIGLWCWRKSKATATA
jgi:hypothetical protein